MCVIKDEMMSKFINKNIDQQDYLQDYLAREIQQLKNQSVVFTANPERILRLFLKVLP